MRRWRWLHSPVDKFPDHNYDDDYKYRGDRFFRHSPLITYHSDNVSIRSASAKSSSVKPPLLWVESTSFTLL